MKIILFLGIIALCINILRLIYSAIVLIISKKARNNYDASIKLTIWNFIEMTLVTYATIKLIINYYN